ncbi:hypothetical protein FJ970_31265 (plasmid) [Mesorhizobium sp. B2-1-8]|uniref:hypothetical protein n=1 Tax=Mesorhizobium sp. B2-1-8 TaxID=2589967 RepID=UPI001D12E9A9|nr:hypothetical protein [Mesorhizobium sp. B2-1-8]UCI22861.1 hypothetical protein FJ970_31265 [Mesorhizobium sp. B2-1-8]
MIVLAITVVSGGCGTPKEKSAPCKRPANLTGYAEDTRTECGSMRLVNPGGTAALAAIDSRAQQSE